MKFITSDGPIRVNSVKITRQSDSIIAISADLAAKYASYDGDTQTDNGPAIMLGVEKDTLHYDNEAYLDGKTTLLSFPEYIGWSVWCAEVVRYTLRVCLVKDN